jgi:hypothetical protein
MMITAEQETSSRKIRKNKKLRPAGQDDAVSSTVPRG